MREIKFRAWIVEDKEMLEWDDTFFSDMSPVTGYGSGFPNGEDVILMQFTGLTDKNGKKEIYEGDILKLIVYKNIGKHSIRSVSFDNGCFGFIDNTGMFFPLGIEIGNKGNEKIFEVIGNIYENPELLTVKE